MSVRATHLVAPSVVLTAALRVAVGLLGVVLLGAGCAQTVNVKVDGPHSAARFGEVALGEVPAGGKPVEVPAGVFAVPYEVEHGAEVARGEIARTEPNLWLLSAAIGGVVCCVPGALALGFCVANPGMLVAAPLVLLGVGDLGAITAGCVAPSWATLPLLSGCGALGLSPAVAALWADAPPPEVVLPAPPAPIAEPTAEPVVGMAW